MFITTIDTPGRGAERQATATREMTQTATVLAMAIRLVDRATRSTSCPRLASPSSSSSLGAKDCTPEIIPEINASEIIVDFQ